MDRTRPREGDEAEDTWAREPKRAKTCVNGLVHVGNKRLTRHEYTIAWICALPLEMAAARAMLDEVHEGLCTHTDDSNNYVLGSINEHNIVIACLPEAQYGTNNAAIVMTNLKRTFSSIRAGLMVGIGGGAPSKADIRLGDIVVGTRVMQYDLGKLVGDGELLRTAIPRIPPQFLGTLVSKLRSKHDLESSRVPSILKEKLRGHTGYDRPSSPDRLFLPTYDHESSTGSCDGCESSKLVPRSRRISDDIKIHYGAIASGNQVMRSGSVRDRIARQLDIICFEMEAAGLMDILPCLPIRGICDYSDSHKSKEWQRYAAATAAAYARELLEELPATEENTRISYTSNPHQSLSQQRRQRFLDSLKFEQIDSRKLTVKSAYAKTCQWFLKHPDYQAWLDSGRLREHNGFLWISGKPGAGKSTIMKFTYLNMRRKARGGNAITASFFFNARGEYLERSVVGMYRALLLQLLEGYPDLQTVLDDPDLVSPNQEGCPSLNVLKNLFRSAVSALGQRSFTCFVDALDECDEQQVMDMVQYFEELAEPFIDHGLLLRICFSSRHYPYIVVQRGIRLTLEDQPGHAEDLKSYIANRLRVKHAAQLIEEILRKAGSVFLWVVLVVDILNKEYARGGLALRNRLKEIPSDLSELFRDILRRDKENMEDLLLCILWILYAKRPLQPKEFHHALWSGLSLKGLADSDIPDTTGPDADDSANRCVISSSKGLAEITKSKQPTVQFIHESVRDFLVKDKGLQELWPEFGFNSRSPSHERLKQCCDSYMNHTTVRASVDRSSFNGIPNEQAEILKQYPFLEYASQHVLYHSNAAADAIPQDKFLSDLSVSSWVSTNNLFEKFRVRKYTLDANLFYILAEKGFSELIRTRLKTDPNVHVYGERYRYPLFAALANGNNDAVAALLNSPSPICDGVDITEGLNTRKEFKNYQCQTPLFWAVQNGRQGIVKLLLQTDNSINEVEGVLQTLLSQASENGHEAVARLLIEKGADVNTCDSDGWKPINKALNSGHEAVASLLIENGADIDTCDKDGITPLLRASSIGNEAMVRFLLKNGANVNTCDRNGQTPLSQALPRGHEGVARLLIDKGADLNVGTSNSILWASLYGYAELAKRLIEKGENVNVCDVDKWSPLHHASANGHEAMVRVLIENGANVNACDNDKRTPLILASRVGNSYEVIASLLIEKGADVNACDKRGWTPLSRAISSGYGAMARLLVANGAVKESSN